MGCSGSKPATKARTEAASGSSITAAPDIDITSLEKAQTLQHELAKGADKDKEEERQDSRRMTSSGFMSDLGSDRAAFTSAFVVNHAGRKAVAELEKRYDTTGGTVLGRGACGSVVAVRQRETNELFAMKVVALETVGGTMEELKKEIEIQRTLDHPNICKIFETYEDQKHGEMYIIMELCTGGALVSRMKNHRHGYGEAAAATIVEKILSSIIYCHHHGIVHRDIKLDNLIYENEAEEAELKLIDFGFACEIASGREAMWDQLGTPSYMAPELWSSHPEYDSSVDMWAIGVVTYMLLSGKRPFHDDNKREKARMIKHDALRFPDHEWKGVSKEAKDFCCQMMQKQPKDRLSATAAKDHPWIKMASTIHKGEDIAVEMQRHNEVVASLQAFSEADDLKKLALEVIAFATPPSKLEELRGVFVKMDADDSGTISRAEFRNAMSLCDDVPAERVEQMYSQMDVDGSGEVDYTEFLSATLSAQKHSNASIMNAFTTLDTDGDGYITNMDIQQSLAGQMSQSAIKEMLEVATGSRDGKVSFQDFKRIVLSGLKSESKDVGSLNVAIAEMSMHPGRLSRVEPSSPTKDEDEPPRSPKSPPPADKKAAPAAPADKKAASAAPAADKKAAPAAPADKQAASAPPADKKVASAAPADKKAAPAAPADKKAASAAPADKKAAPAAPADKVMTDPKAAGEPSLEKKEPTQYL